MVPQSKKTTNKEKTDFAWRRLGFLQLSLLMHLWQKEMYGVQIKDHLALDGYDVDDNQLYPALKGLEENGFLEITSHKGKKKHYRTTLKGRNVVGEYIVQFYGLFNERILEKLLFVRDEIMEYVEIKRGMVIADFSRRFSELQINPLMTIGQELGPIGRLFIHNLHPKFYDITEKRIQMMGGQPFTTLLEPEVDFESSNPKNMKTKSPLPDGSVDLGLSIFTLHMSGTNWILPELARILKPGGKAVIASSFDATEVDIRYAFMSVFLDILEELYPFASKIGVSKEIIEDQLKQNGLEILKQKEGNGAYYFLVTKPVN